MKQRARSSIDAPLRRIRSLPLNASQRSTAPLILAPRVRFGMVERRQTVPERRAAGARLALDVGLRSIVSGGGLPMPVSLFVLVRDAHCGPPLDLLPGRPFRRRAREIMRCE